MDQNFSSEDKLTSWLMVNDAAGESKTKIPVSNAQDFSRRHGTNSMADGQFSYLHVGSGIYVATGLVLLAPVAAFASSLEGMPAAAPAALIPVLTVNQVSVQHVALPEGPALAPALALNLPTMNAQAEIVSSGYTTLSAPLLSLGAGTFTPTFPLPAAGTLAFATPPAATVPNDDITRASDSIRPNETPTITTNDSLNYTEGQAAAPINAGVVLVDDNINLVSASVQIGSGYVNGEDVLGFTTQNGITGDFNALTGTLTLMGSATVGQYQAAINSVTYFNNNIDDPNGVTRVLHMTVNDGTSDSSIATSTINVVPVNDAPVVTAGNTLNYTENQAAAAIAPALILADVDNLNLTTATVAITNNFASGQDVLSFTPVGNITGSYNSATGVLTLSGNDTLAQYQTALASVKYSNTSESPSEAARTITFTVDDGSGSNHLGFATSTINVTSVNDLPVMTGGSSRAFVENATPVALNPGAMITDIDHTTMSGATVQITGNYQSGVTGDILGFVNQNGITGSYNSTTGVLTLTGSASATHYQTALNSVTYASGENPGSATRTISFSVSDGVDSSSAITSTVAVTPVNDAPIVIAGNTLNYVENQTATPMTSIVINDDSLNLVSAVVQVTSGYVNGQDIISFTNQNGITGVFTASLGKWTLTGSASVADYQTAINSITYTNNSNTPNTGVRTVSITVNDGSFNSATATSTVTVASVNDAPVVTAGNTLNYTENGVPAVVASALTITDVDSANITGATVAITGNFASGEDVLSFTNTVFITGSYNAATGVLTLSGTTTKANYQAALRTVKYSDSSNDPSNDPRTVTFTVDDGSGSNNLGSATSTINVTPVNDAAVVTAGGSLAYTENQAATAINANAVITDVDDTNIESASVRIAGSYANGQDILEFTPQNGITGTFIASTGTMALTGTATLAQYQDAINSITYRNTLDNPSGLTRTLSITVNDGNVNSVAVTSTITVAPTNDAPVVIAGGLLNYTENQVAAAIAPALTVTDLDSVNITGATVAITGNFASGEDVLSFTNTVFITGSYNAATGVLTLSGTTTKGNYQTALRTVKYSNSSNDPSDDPRTVTFTVNDGSGSNNLGSATRTINVIPVNDAAVVTAGGTLAYTENQAPTVVNAAVVVTDADNSHLSSATVQITTNYVNGQDVLAFNNTANITGSFNAATGLMTLTGSDTVANYQAALRSVTYANTSEAPTTTTRTVTFRANDGTVNSTAVTSTITVAAVNDAPINNKPLSDYNVVMATATSLTGLSISDIDAAATNVVVTLSATSGILTVATNVSGGVTAGQVSANASGTVTITSTVAKINATLANANGLKFTGAPGSVNDVTLTMTTNDQGNVGSGGALLDVDTMIIHVHPFTYAMGSLPTAVTLTITGTGAATFSGASVGGSGDFNGDGLNDILIGGAGATGHAYLINGAATGLTGSFNLSSLNGTNGFTITGGSGVGIASHIVGDFNGDGKGDILISSPTLGTAYLYYGTAIESNMTTVMDGSNGFQITGTAGQFARAVTGGDLNGDGLRDLIFQNTTGTTQVLLGTSSMGASFAIGSLNGTNGFTITNLANTTNASVSTVDFNGDGIQDVIMGSSLYNASAGAATLVFGSDSSLGANITASTLTGSSGANPHGFNFTGLTAGNTVGSTVAGLRDFNGDGYGDLIIGASGADKAYLVLGQADMNVGTINASSFGSTVQGFTINGTGSGETIVNVANAGDFNGDGYSDVLVAAENSAHTSDTVYLIYGSNSTANINLATFSVTQGIKVTGVTPVSFAAGSNENWLQGLGDVNGDGFDDFAIGNPAASSNTGATTVIYGFANDITRVVSGSGQVINGNAGIRNVIEDTGSNNTITGGSVGDKLIGGHGDILNGGAGNDSLRGSVGSLTLNGGTGNDVMWGSQGDNTFSYNLATDGAGTDVIHGAQGGSWVDSIDLSGMSEGPSATLGAVGSWTLVVDGQALTDVAASGSMTFADRDQGGTIQIQVTAGTVETMRFDDIENVQWHS